MNIGYAYTNPMFQPAMRIVSNITRAYPALVTTTFAHLYESGLIVRLFVPYASGMRQLHGYSGQITVITPTSFTIPIDTTNFDTFIPSPFPIPTPIPLPKDNDCSLVIPIGQNSNMWSSSVHNIYG